MKLEEYSQAFDYFTQAIEFKPDYAIAYYPRSRRKILILNQLI